MNKAIGFVLTLAGVVLFGGLFYFAGVVSTRFTINICYNDVIDSITKSGERAAASKDPSALLRWSEKINTLPLHGYESSCPEIRDAALGIEKE